MGNNILRIFIFFQIYIFISGCSISNTTSNLPPADSSSEISNPILDFSSTNISVTKNQGSVSLQISLNKTTTKDIKLRLSREVTSTDAGNTITTLFPLEVTVPASSNSLSIPLTIVDDKTYESSKSLILSISSPDSDFDVGTNSQILISLLPAKKKLRKLNIFYGWPSAINGATDLDQAASVFAQFDDVVLGDGLQEVTHGDHLNTISIITKARLLNPQIQFFGYIPMGYHSWDIPSSLSLVQITAATTKWLAMGIDGMFCDEMGMDYKFPTDTDADWRTRQKSILDHMHSNNLKTIINAWDPDDIFTKESLNPLSISNRDGFLVESFWRARLNAGRMNFSNYLTNIQKLKAARNLNGVEIYAINTTSNETTNLATFTNMILSAQIEGFQSVGWGQEDYFATNSIVPIDFINSTFTSWNETQFTSSATNAGSYKYTIQLLSGNSYDLIYAANISGILFSPLP